MTSLRTAPNPSAIATPAEEAAPEERAGRVSWAEAVGLVAVLALAAALRIGWPGVHTWSYDEARVALLALETARGGDIAAVGIQSSAGLPNLPAAVWLYALPLAISPDPLVASLWTGAVNVLAIAGLWWLVRRSAGPWAGLTAAALWAGAPFGAFYSRAIWSQDLLGPLAVAWALLGMRAAQAERREDRIGSVALAAHVFVAGLAPQVHFAGAALLLPTLWLLVRRRWWRRPRPLVAGAALAAAAALPYVVALWRADALRGTLQAALSGAGGEAGAPRELVGLQRLLEMGVGRGWEWFLLGGEWQWAEGWTMALTVASVGAGILLLLGAVALALRLRRGRGRTSEPLDALLPAWLLGAPLLFLGHLTPAYHQYQLAALPALFALGGYGAVLLPR
ncbi:MAG: glycosyltransferase family 39 protein, partial [Chloroflexi bacterium]|nr:glycosyltransferase family 39 protein [Chloroflexota bacterium]